MGNPDHGERPDKASEKLPQGRSADQAHRHSPIAVHLREAGKRKTARVVQPD